MLFRSFSEDNSRPDCWTIVVGSDFLAVWGGSGGKGRQGASEGVKRCKPLSPLRYSVVWRSSVRAVEFKGVGGGCIRLAKKVPPGQTLFSNILFFQPELKNPNFFPRTPVPPTFFSRILSLWIRMFRWV